MLTGSIATIITLVSMFTGPIMLNFAKHQTRLIVIRISISLIPTQLLYSTTVRVAHWVSDDCETQFECNW